MARMTKLKRMIRNMYTTREHGTGHVFCVPPSFVLIDNKYILSCATIRRKQPVERKQGVSK